MIYSFFFFVLTCLVGCIALDAATPKKNLQEGLPLFFWKEGNFTNFGDYLSLKIVERIVGTPLRYYNKRSLNVKQSKKLLALGSILYFANEGDVVWGSGINGKRPYNNVDYNFNNLDVRAVRGPLTRAFIVEHFRFPCPEIYGDPALLLPYLFPEFKRSENPTYDYIIIPNYLDAKYFTDTFDEHLVLATDPWDSVIERILDSGFVISSSLHGIIVAEAYGIPARMLRISVMNLSSNMRTTTILPSGLILNMPEPSRRPF